MLESDKLLGDGGGVEGGDGLDSNGVPFIDDDPNTITTTTNTITSNNPIPRCPGPAPPTICYGRILLGEVTPLLSAMKRSTPRWSSHQQGMGQDSLVEGLREVREVVSGLRDGDALDPNTFLHPFLAVIRSEDTTGPVTKTALAAVNRMLVYGLVWEGQEGASSAVEAIAGAVTHARFVGTDQGADEVVLWEILTVLRTLMLGGAGRLLTNEAVCEILNSAFRICFEPRLSELLRTCTEDALTHMVQLLFSRLPLFPDHAPTHTRKLKMRAAAGQARGKRGSDTPTPPPTQQHEETQGITTDHATQNNISVDIETPKESVDQNSPDNSALDITPDASTPKEGVDGEGRGDGAETASVDSGIVEVGGGQVDISHTHLAPDTPAPLTPDDPPNTHTHKQATTPAQTAAETDGSKCSRGIQEQQEQEQQPQQKQQKKQEKDVEGGQEGTEDFTNSQGVKFEGEGGGVESSGVLVPHGAACVREVLRFLVSLTAPTNEQNTPAMTLTALNLLTAGLEIGAAEVGRRGGLLALVADPLCHHLLGLLRGEGRVGLAVFGAATRLAVLLIESLRNRLKFQVEALMARLAHVATEEGTGPREGHRELALEALAQLWGGAGLAGQVYLNYDCDLYCSDLFEDITRTLANTTFPSGPDPAALTALAALMAVVSDIRDRNQPNPSMEPLPAPTPQTKPQCLRCPPAPLLVARAGVGEGMRMGRGEAAATKQRKKTLWAGTEQFNNKPDKGLKMLQEAGASGRTPEEVASFLRHNPRICKRALGDYLSRKKNVEVLAAFVCTFNFTGQRVDESLRVFLESFRLPGEAPLISAVIEHFAAHWHDSNGKPFAKEDAAFTLAYAIIMLNVDQHSPAARRQNIPMTLSQFTNNLRGVNGGGDFDPGMLEAVYNAIKKEEIVMPAEHAGRVREDYQWRLLLRRAATPDARFLLPARPTDLDRDLFLVCWGPTVAALSCVLDRGGESEAGRAVEGFGACGAVAAKLGLVEVLDNLVATLCKFTGLDAVDPPDQLATAFAASRRAQLAAGAAVGLAAGHGDGLRDAWANVVQLLLQLFRCRLLPQPLVTSPDPLASGGQVCLLPQPPAPPRPEAGLLSSLYSYISMSDAGAGRGVEEGAGLGRAKACVAEIRPSRLLEESTFLRADSLAELLKAITGAGAGQDGVSQHDQSFLLELSVRVVEANKDRALAVWPNIRDHIYALLVGAAATKRHFLLDRCVAALLRLASLLLRRPAMASPVMQALRMLLLLRPNVMQRVALAVLAGLREVVSVNTEHLQDPRDWVVVFTLLECSGAGAAPPPMMAPDLPPPPQPPPPPPPSSDTLSDTGSISDSEAGSGIDSGNGTDGPFDTLDPAPSPRPAPPRSRAASPDALHNPGGWILVGREGEIEAVPVKGVAVNEWDIVHQREMGPHRPDALALGVETLAHLVRDRRITRASLPAAVLACRTFVEATLNGGKAEKRVGVRETNGGASGGRRKGSGTRKRDDRWSGRRGKSNHDPSSGGGAGDGTEEPSEEDLTVLYQQVSEKLLDLMDTLHTSAGEIVGLGDTNTNQQTATHHDNQTNNSSNSTSTPHPNTNTNTTATTAITASPNTHANAHIPSPHISTEAVSITVGHEDVAREGIHDHQTNTTTALTPIANHTTTTNTLSSAQLDTRQTSAAAAVVESAPQTPRETPKEPEQPSDHPTTTTEQQETTTAAAEIESHSLREGVVDNSAGRVCLWAHAVCPLLQGMARYCCDARPQIRNQAMTYLQRALLNHDLQTLTAAEWEACFNKVLFPLLAQLLTPPHSSPTLEETRVRAATLVQKVYLRHLTPLLTLPTFTALWLTILDFMDKYLNTHRSDHLSDAIPEILKNMLLVMETTQVFHTADGFTRLWSITWDRIDAFLPHFRHNLFHSHPPSEIHKIEVVPSDSHTSQQQQPPSPSPPTQALMEEGGRGNSGGGGGGSREGEAYVPPTLREQQAARLSLSQESLPTGLGVGVILQPPLPPLSSPASLQAPIANGSTTSTTTTLTQGDEIRS